MQEIIQKYSPSDCPKKIVEKCLTELWKYVKIVYVLKALFYDKGICEDYFFVIESKKFTNKIYDQVDGKYKDINEYRCSGYYYNANDDQCSESGYIWLDHDRNYRIA